MKSFFFFIVLLFFVGYYSIACQPKTNQPPTVETESVEPEKKLKPDELIVGSWQGKELILSEDMIKTLSPQFQLLMDKIVGEMKRELIRTKMEFGKDLTYHVFSFDRWKDFGRYQIRNDGKFLLLITEDMSAYSPLSEIKNNEVSSEENTNKSTLKRKEIFRISNMDKNNFSLIVQFIDTETDSKIDFTFKFSKI